MGKIKIKLRKFQVFLLELNLKLLKDSKTELVIHRNYTWNDIFSPGWAEERAVGKSNKKEKEQKRKIEKLKQLVKNLKRRGYLEEKREADKRLFYLTSKAQFEIFYCKFLKQLEGESQKKWDRKWRIIMFDVPETQRKFRNTLRKILKLCFVQWQKSIWITPYDIITPLLVILEYLHLVRYIDYLEVSKLNNESGFLKKFDLNAK